MTKKRFIISILITLPILLFAQKPKVKNDPTHDDKLLHFGFSLGVNTMDYYVEPSKMASDSGTYMDVNGLSPGINIHAIANLRLAKYLDLRALPGISFGERLLHFTDIEGKSKYSEGEAYIVESSYIEFPLLFKYRAKRINNFSPFMIAGANFRYDLAIKKEYDLEDQLIMVQPFDSFVEFGLGMDFYLTYFKFAVELKYSLGMLNIIRYTNNDGEVFDGYQHYSEWIERLNTHMFILSFHFE